MSQEIKLEEEIKEKIRTELDQYEVTMEICIDRLYEVSKRLGILNKNVELEEFSKHFLNTHSKKHTVLSQFTELKEAMDQGMESIIEVDEELGTTIFKIGEVVTGGSDV